MIASLGAGLGVKLGSKATKGLVKLLARRAETQAEKALRANDAKANEFIGLVRDLLGNSEEADDYLRAFQKMYDDGGFWAKGGGLKLRHADRRSFHLDVSGSKHPLHADFNPHGNPHAQLSFGDGDGRAIRIFRGGPKSDYHPSSKNFPRDLDPDEIEFP